MSGSVDPGRRKRQLTESFEGARKTISRHLERLRAHGILAVRDGGDRHGYTQRYKESGAVGKYPAISLLVSGKAWHKPGRYGSFVGRALKGGTSGGRNSEGKVTALITSKLSNPV
jgi:DNA-binding transcriptional ArsR family regulator